MKYVGNILLNLALWYKVLKEVKNIPEKNPKFDVMKHELKRFT